MRWTGGDGGAQAAGEDVLRAEIKRIVACWRRFRGRLRRVAGARIGGFASIEVAGAVHLHALAYLPFVAQSWVSETWHAVTGDSMIADIRAVDGAAAGMAGACQEVAKYISKGVGGDDVDALVRVYRATRRMQLHRAWGVAHGLVLRPEMPPIVCPRCGASEWMREEDEATWALRARAPP